MFRGMMDIANGQPMDESFYDVMGVPTLTKAGGSDDPVDIEEADVAVVGCGSAMRP